MVDEVADVGKIDDLFHAQDDVLFFHAELEAVEDDVLLACESGFKPGSEGKHGGVGFRIAVNDSAVGVDDSRNDTEETAFAGSVSADDSEGVSSLNLERDVLKRPESTVFPG